MKLKNVLYIFLIVQFLTYPTAAVLASDPDDLRGAIDQKAQELESLNQKIQETQQKIEATQNQKTTLNKELQRLDYTLSQINLGIKSSEIKIEKTALEIEALEQEIAQKEGSIAANRQAVAEFLRLLYQKDRESLLLTIVKSRSLAESLAEIQNISNLNSGLESAIRSLKDLHARLQRDLQSKKDNKNRLATEKTTLKNREAIAGEQKKERGTLLAQTKNQEQLYQSQLNSLEKQQQVIHEEIENFEDELRRRFDPTLLPLKRPGVLSWPLANPRITQNFGEVSWLYRGKPHNGMDFGVPVGSELFAADDGTVVMVENNGRYQYGKYVLIKHDNNLTTLYAHLSRQIVQNGQRVKRGEVIGYSGNTGYVIGRGHLHFGLYWAPSVSLKTFPNCPCGIVPVGVTIDPLDYL